MKFVPAFITTVVLIVSSPASADGECEKIKSIPERLTCVEKKADAAIKAAATADSTAKNALNKKGKLVSTSREQCLTWQDNAKSTVTLSCDHADQEWTIR